ncbi:sugar porter family MFS transporter [Carboxylicivirga taeanensis]|uniref:sugar porter family MFS transporter n=1 Tax=Carboxylicivirga taeanensis TaxID=1416875 RepID=UPI003F6E15BB
MRSENIKYVTFLSVIAACGGFLFGYDTAVISGTIVKVAEQFQLDVIQQGWYVGCALIGSIFGVSVAGVVGDKYGRKKTMVAAAVLFSMSAIGCTMVNSFSALVFYRIIGGIGIGVVSIISPLYISELAVTRLRGSLVATYQLAITVGFLGAYWVNYHILEYSSALSPDATGFANYIFGKEFWRGMLGAETLPALIFFILIFFIPESPRWLISKNNEAEALSTLNKIYIGKEAVNQQLSEIKTSIQSAVGSDWTLIRKPGIFKAIVYGVLIAILGQFMGVNAVLYYGPMIFESSGLSGGDSLFYQILVGLVNTITTVIALLIIDKVGRKKLVYFGVSGMLISLVALAAFFKFGSTDYSYLLLIFFLAYIFCCAISICAVVWVLLSEMYPTKIRGVAMSIAGFSLWIGTYCIGQLTPWLLENAKPAGTFLLFAFMCLPYMWIVWRKIPETAGKSLEEIEQHWE